MTILPTNRSDALLLTMQPYIFGQYVGFQVLKRYDMTYTLIGFNEKSENLLIPMVDAITFLKDPVTGEYMCWLDWKGSFLGPNQ